jgi:methionyl-tRNA formyltransferase
MNVIFFGTPDYAVPSLEALLANSAFQVLGVVTQPDKRRGRGAQLIPSPIKQVAIAHQLPVWQPQRVKKDAETLDALCTSQADAFVVVAYGQILSPEILAMPRLACINAHGSILPTYRGAAPIQWSLYNGDRETGITTMLMDAGMDTGPMLLKSHTAINLLDNAQTLADRLAQMSADLLVETLLTITREGIQPTPQDDTQATYARLIQKQDYELDWSRPALDLHNQIRGFFPHCLATYHGQSLKILATTPLGPNYWAKLPPDLQTLQSQWDALIALEPEPPGTVVSIAKGLGPIIQLHSGYLLIREVQPKGKRPQSGWDFVNGNHVTVGDRLLNGNFNEDEP